MFDRLGGDKIGYRRQRYNGIVDLASPSRKEFGHEDSGMASRAFLLHADIGAVTERVGQSKPFGSFLSHEASRFGKLTNKMPTLPLQVRLLVGR